MRSVGGGNVRRGAIGAYPAGSDPGLARTLQHASTGRPRYLWAPAAPAPTERSCSQAAAYFLAFGDPAGPKAPSLKMSEAFALAMPSSFLKKLLAVKRSSPAVHAS